MKKIILILLISIYSVSSFSQKKKTTKAVIASPVLAKVDNLVVEVKSGSFQLTINENGKPKDAIIVKAADAKFTPTDCKLVSFKASGATLYMLSWTEKYQTKTDLKNRRYNNYIF